MEPISVPVISYSTKNALSSITCLSKHDLFFRTKSSATSSKQAALTAWGFILFSQLLYQAHNLGRHFASSLFPQYVRSFNNNNKKISLRAKNSIGSLDPSLEAEGTAEQDAGGAHEAYICRKGTEEAIYK